MKVAIVGAGFSGLSLALNLHGQTRQALDILLFQAGDDFGRGTAYSTPYPYHLLNVPAKGMSAFASRPDDFVDWLLAHKPGQTFATADEPLAKQFVPRQVYGEYLRHLLARAKSPSPQGTTLERISSQVTALQRRNNNWRVHTDTGMHHTADIVVLATGNEAPNPFFVDIPGDVYLNNPWEWERLKDFARKPSLLIIGTGLTMVDVSLTLINEGYQGIIVALSRRGLLPKPHRWHVPTTTFQVDLDDCASAGAIRRQLMAHLEDHPQEDWRALVDSLRPHTQAIWMSWSLEEKAHFLKEHRAHWDIHRHRIAPDIAARIQALRDAGRLRILTAGIAGARLEDGAAAVTVNRNDQPGTTEKHVFAGIVNCTGPNCDIARSKNPLMRSLLQGGLVRGDALGLGIDVDQYNAVLDSQGAPQPALFAVGPLTKALLWEIVAVPDIRNQTAALTEHIVGSVCAR